MKFSEYSEIAHRLAFYPHELGLTYPLIGLVGEVGEFCGKLKKFIRDEGKRDAMTMLTVEDMIKLRNELGDILWYVNELAIKLNSSLESVAQANLEKLAGRKARNTLAGSGDDR